jgi:ketosteroid isomerase-like protein
MTDLERLVAIEAVRQLKARYFRAMDTKAFDELNEVFADDAVFDARQSRYDPRTGEPPPQDGTVWEGRETIVGQIRQALTLAVSVHHGHTPEIEILSETRARALVPMEDIVEGVADGVAWRLHGFGHYRETYEKIGGAWRIKTSTLTRLKVDFTERPAA